MFIPKCINKYVHSFSMPTHFWTISHSEHADTNGNNCCNFILCEQQKQHYKGKFMLQLMLFLTHICLYIIHLIFLLISQQILLLLLLCFSKSFCFFFFFLCFLSLCYYLNIPSSSVVVFTITQLYIIPFSKSFCCCTFAFSKLC